MQRLRELNPKDCEMSVCFELSSCDSSFSPYITGQFASLKKTDLIKKTSHLTSDERFQGGRGRLTWWSVNTFEALFEQIMLNLPLQRNTSLLHHLE